LDVTFRDAILNHLEQFGETDSDIIASSLTEEQLSMTPQAFHGESTLDERACLVWTRTRVIFVRASEGFEQIDSVPRNPPSRQFTDDSAAPVATGERYETSPPGVTLPGRFRFGTMIRAIFSCLCRNGPSEPVRRLVHRDSAGHIKIVVEPGKSSDR
jgi:hypothetical protein